MMMLSLQSKNIARHVHLCAVPFALGACQAPSAAHAADVDLARAEQLIREHYDEDADVLLSPAEETVQDEAGHD
jgi:hypothetical protein